MSDMELMGMKMKSLNSIKFTEKIKLSAVPLEVPSVHGFPNRIEGMFVVMLH